MPQRHIPERTCVACRSLRPKREMVRVVRTAGATNGSPPVVQIDRTGKLSGRGAYLCQKAECWDRALRRDILSRALKTELSVADRQALSAHRDEMTIRTHNGSAARPVGPAAATSESPPQP